MKKEYTRKQAEKILIDKGYIWTNCHDLHFIYNQARIKNQAEVMTASRNLNGYILGY